MKLYCTCTFSMFYDHVSEMTQIKPTKRNHKTTNYLSNAENSTLHIETHKVAKNRKTIEKVQKTSNELFSTFPTAIIPFHSYLSTFSSNFARQNHNSFYATSFPMASNLSPRLIQELVAKSSLNELKMDRLSQTGNRRNPNSRP